MSELKDTNEGKELVDGRSGDQLNQEDVLL